MESKGNKPAQQSSRLLILIGLSTAFLLVMPILILLAVGYFADIFFHTKPLFTILGVIIGSVGGIMNVFRLLQTAKKWNK